MNLIAKRKIWYTISLLVIVPGLVSLALHGLRLGIDFRGGSVSQVSGSVTNVQAQQLAQGLGFQDITVTPGGNNSTLISYLDSSAPTTQQTNHEQFKQRLANAGYMELSFNSVGPSVSRSIARNAILAIILASIAIVLYVAFAFRNAPPPVSPWSFGVCAIIALLHDALLVIGVFSILGWLFKIEIDSLFVTAVLTVIGFSVHDTIVVFDRIRENLRRQRGSFESVVNTSILQTMARSINTSFTVLLTLLALYLFGGTTIRYFILALLIGITSGAYSSIFNASPLLVTWHNYKLKHAKA